MSKEMGVIALGVFVVIQPYLGVPGSWHTFLSVIAGIGIMVLGFLLRGEALAGGRLPAGKGSSRHSFVENTTATVVQDHSEHDHKHLVN